MGGRRPQTCQLSYLLHRLRKAFCRDCLSTCHFQWCVGFWACPLTSCKDWHLSVGTAHAVWPVPSGCGRLVPGNSRGPQASLLSWRLSWRTGILAAPRSESSFFIFLGLPSLPQRPPERARLSFGSERFLTAGELDLCNYYLAPHPSLLLLWGFSDTVLSGLCYACLRSSFQTRAEVVMRVRARRKCDTLRENY